jgi:hypothetical protein
MPPLVNSRYFTVRGKRTEVGIIYLGERDPLDPDEIFDGTEDVHVVTGKESLGQIAALYWTTGNEQPDDPGPEADYWIIAELNGIDDPTVDPKPGDVLYIPSLRTKNEKILNKL